MIDNAIVKEIQNIAMEAVLMHYNITVSGSGRSKGVSKCPRCEKDFDDIKFNTEQQLMHCFVCGFGGNVYNVIMEIEHCSFLDAVRICADIIGYELPKSNLNTKEILNDAAIFFRKNYIDQLEFRGLNAETAKRYCIGYAIGRDTLSKHLKSLGYSDQEMLSSGLCKLNDKQQIVDKYFKSAVFPDVQNGKVIDFYFRLLDDKYKSKHQLLKGKNNLIGRHLIKDSKVVAVCEAPIDAASFNQLFNIPALSICGSWTKVSNNIRTLVTSRKLEQVIIAFDNDDSGKEAIVKLIESLLDLEIEILVLNFNDKDVNQMLLNGSEFTFEDGRFIYFNHMASKFSQDIVLRYVREVIS